MLKQVVVATAAIAIVGTGYGYAQRFGGPDGPGLERIQRQQGPSVDQGPSMTRGYRVTADDLGAFADARIAGVKAGLRLNADQEKYWPAFEQAWRSLAKLRADVFLAARDNPEPPAADILERMQRRSDALSKRAAAVKDFTDATTPLYRSLDETQKRRFTVLARVLQPMPVPGAGVPDRRPGMRPGGPDGPFQRGGMDRPGMPGGGVMERTLYQDFRDAPENAVDSDAAAAEAR